MKSTFENINQILAKTAIDGIGALSKGIAESIILGKSLGDSFRQFVQQAIVNALASLIQFYATKLLIYAIEKLFGIEIPKQVDLENLTFDPAEVKQQMVDIMLSNNGIGLAANQIGLDAQVFVMGDSANNSTLCINPTVLQYTSGATADVEGCLSFPNVFVKINRPKKYWLDSTMRI